MKKKIIALLCLALALALLGNAAFSVAYAAHRCVQAHCPVCSALRSARLLSLALASLPPLCALRPAVRRVPDSRPSVPVASPIVNKVRLND